MKMVGVLLGVWMVLVAHWVQGPEPDAGINLEMGDPDFDYCSMEFEPCKNAGKCINEGTGSICECSSNFTGPRCEYLTDPSKCKDHECQHEASCFSLVEPVQIPSMELQNPVKTVEYQCVCKPGYFGFYCEDDNAEYYCGKAFCIGTDSKAYVEYGECKCKCRDENVKGNRCEIRLPCYYNGYRCEHGLCINTGEGRSDFKCECYPGFIGPGCENLKVEDLDGCDPCHPFRDLEITSIPHYHLGVQTDKEFKYAETACEKYAKKFSKEENAKKLKLDFKTFIPSANISYDIFVKKKEGSISYEEILRSIHYDSYDKKKYVAALFSSFTACFSASQEEDIDFRGYCNYDHLTFKDTEGQTKYMTVPSCTCKCDKCKATEDCLCYEGGYCESKRRSLDHICNDEWPGNKDVLGRDKACKHNGLCVADPEDMFNKFTCKCRVGWVGEICETEDPCASSICRADSYCILLDQNIGTLTGLQYSCICIPPAEGIHCISPSEPPCDSNPCGNNTCIRCDTFGDPAIACPEPHRRELGYFCICNPGVVGNECNQVWTPCDDVDCENEGLCQNREDIPAKELTLEDYNCICKDGFGGRHCEEPDGVCAKYGHHCIFGECVPDDTNVYEMRCECQEGYTGFVCELETRKTGVFLTPRQELVLWMGIGTLMAAAALCFVYLYRIALIKRKLESRNRAVLEKNEKDREVEDRLRKGEMVSDTTSLLSESIEESTYTLETLTKSETESESEKSPGKPEEEPLIVT